MPKVSQEYRNARREQILAAAKRCFLRNGFHETSMQDLFAEAGLSSGAVYRYFPGKEDMILAIAEENLRDVTELIHALATNRHGDGLGAALAEVLEVVRDKHAQSELGAMAVLVWSEAVRTPALAKQFDVMLGQMRADLADVVRENQASGGLPRAADADALTALLMSIVPGFILQLAIFGHEAVDGVPDAARALWPG
jgi:TetR/AcrR family transcriptional regulator, transcriptional repressor of aconitase